MRSRVLGLLSCVFVVSVLAACGGDVTPSPAVDAGDTDAGTLDAGNADAGAADAALDDGGPTLDDGGPTLDAGFDGGSVADGGDDGGTTLDAGLDAGTDSTDLGVAPPVETCGSCATSAECYPGSFCALVPGVGRACLPSCVPDLPVCPATMACTLSSLLEVDEYVCAPLVDGACTP